MKKTLLQAILILLWSFQAGCERSDKSISLTSSVGLRSSSYSQSSGEYVKVEKLVTRDNTFVEFRGVILEPFSDDQLIVAINGKLNPNNDVNSDNIGYQISGEAGSNSYVLYFEVIVDGQLEGLISVVPTEGDRFSGQWAFTCQPD
ncbi:hypothetical protein AAFN60_21440 [Roseibacillus persicicus]|uniref:hypothetical protein n=1 Tax=Roseibacillus persicicus TaxID=454148 RepID=UPI00398B23A7